MKDLILHLKSQGKTILLSSHLLADVQDVCDRIGILARGELRKLGRVRDLLLVRDVFQMQAAGVSDQAARTIVAAAEAAGARVLSADHPTTTLEDLFLRVIRGEARAPGAPSDEPEAGPSPARFPDDPSA
jgi:ABC-2 type transport system ATP-binding protein